MCAGVFQMHKSIRLVLVVKLLSSPCCVLDIAEIKEHKRYIKNERKQNTFGNERKPYQIGIKEDVFRQ